jgi:hypothetical protein
MHKKNNIKKGSQDSHVINYNNIPVRNPMRKFLTKKGNIMFF